MIPPEIRAHFLELFQEPNLQALTAALFENMEELAVLVPLLVRASAIFSRETAPALMPRVHKLLFTGACSNSSPPQRR
jgi:hypothetical protein